MTANRELIVRIDAKASSAKGAGSVLVYRLGSHIEIVATEENGGDAAVLVSEEQALALARAVAAALPNASR
jgi:hypothetical protein